MMAQAREQAIDRMIEEAAALGANGVIGVHFQTSMVLSGRPRSSATGRPCASSPRRRRGEGS
jgi:uncharacterized protein YbjQ (UPF0145 family)